MTRFYDLIGVGIGPFHLSLAALAHPISKLQFRFFEQKAQFSWHPHLQFADAEMQTSYLKDLVTPVDPTSRFSFLNYLVKNSHFYAFLNTARRVMTRREFEAYACWVSAQIPQLSFGNEVYSVDHDGKYFIVETAEGLSKSQHLSFATGMQAEIPESARAFLGKNVFHASSPELWQSQLSGKRIALVGGGQTGLEIFRHILAHTWGEAHSVHWISRRSNLQVLDESPFTNEYFSPAYVEQFRRLRLEQRLELLDEQKLASDGISPQDALEIYRQLYLRKVLGPASPLTRIICATDLSEIRRWGESYQLVLSNSLQNRQEVIEADIVILATGFRSRLPSCLEPLLPRLEWEASEQLRLEQNFRVSWDGPSSSHLYALNFGRHSHGIAEPQTSLMAWRSAMILNDLLGEKYYPMEDRGAEFLIHFGP